MLHVTSLNLSRDLRHAQPDLGRCDLGPVDAPALVAMLETFRGLDEVQNHDARPALFVATATDQFLIRTEGGKLFLFDPRDTLASGIEIEPSALAAQLTRRAPSPRRARRPRRERLPLLLCGLIVSLGLVANGVILHAALAPHPVEPISDLSPLSDVSEIAAVLHSARGFYHTGNQPGDRALRLDADGRIELLQFTPGGERLAGEDRVTPARDGRQLRLVSTQSGIIDVVNIDTLTYYRDTYRRVR